LLQLKILLFEVITFAFDNILTIKLLNLKSASCHDLILVEFSSLAITCRLFTLSANYEKAPRSEKNMNDSGQKSASKHAEDITTGSTRQIERYIANHQGRYFARNM